MNCLKSHNGRECPWLASPPIPNLIGYWCESPLVWNDRITGLLGTALKDRRGRRENVRGEGRAWFIEVYSHDRCPFALVDAGINPYLAAHLGEMWDFLAEAWSY